MKSLRILALFATILFSNSVFADKIITIYDGDDSQILKRKADAIEPNKKGLKMAKKIASRLKKTLKPMMPVAGLAAPQIGISKQIFIYSWDRSWENIEVVINPQIVDHSAFTNKRWEACISTIKSDGTYAKAALVDGPRWIEVAYMTLEGERVRKKLHGFAARVFMHEFDHLEGQVNVERKDIKVRSFVTMDEFNTFMKSIRSKDKYYYRKPIDIEDNL